jgi:hypothetical protein
LHSYVSWHFKLFQFLTDVKAASDKVASEKAAATKKAEETATAAKKVEAEKALEKAAADKVCIISGKS